MQALPVLAVGNATTVCGGFVSFAAMGKGMHTIEFLFDHLHLLPPQHSVLLIGQLPCVNVAFS
jgi:hypothetical protein